MNSKTRAAIHAARNIGTWGRDAARRYARNHGVTPGAYRIARQCEELEALGLVSRHPEI